MTQFYNNQLISIGYTNVQAGWEAGSVQVYDIEKGQTTEYPGVYFIKGLNGVTNPGSFIHGGNMNLKVLVPCRPSYQQKCNVI